MTTSHDSTFRTFTPAQAAAYASGRGGAYPSPLYQTILDFHKGPTKLCFDVGTGPGKAVWDLLGFFDRCIGCDVSEAMIDQAIRDAETKGFAERTKFFVAGGEDCTKGLSADEVGQVDVLTVAMAAHWMDLPLFYAEAAKALRPGGTLAVWTASSFHAHPSEENAERLQWILHDLEDNMLGPYMKPGNQLAQGGYDGLGLPWDEKVGAERLFEKESLRRVHWDRDGVPSGKNEDGTPGPFMFGEPLVIDEFEDAFGSASAVIRWREAHPDKAGTGEDPVKLTVKRLREAAPGRRSFMAAPSMSLVLIRRV